MFLSNLVKEYYSDVNVKFVNEHEFDTLGLCGVHVGKKKLTFIDGAKFVGDISEDTTMVLATPDVYEILKSKKLSFGIAITDNPRVLFFRIHNTLCLNSNEYKRSKRPTIIGENCRISATAIISQSNVVIGDNVQIDDYAVIKENTIIGDNCKIGAGVKIGYSDFEYKRFDDTIFGVEHVGGVVIGNSVDILANSVVNKAVYPWDNTEIGDYTKIDMLCNISHGVKIGKCVMIVALSGIGGRTVIKDNAWIGYGAIIRNGIVIGENSRVNMGSVVSKNVNDGESVTGNFAIEHNRFMELLKENAKRE